MFVNAHTFCSRIHSTMFGPAQLLLNWGEQWPSNQGELDSSVTGEAGRVYLLHLSGPTALFIFVP
jgi:hypothetical protein